MTDGASLTAAQVKALRWLANRGGEGMFNKNNVLLARGELAAVMRTTWNRLCDAGMVIYSANKSYKRVAITEKGRKVLEGWTGEEAQTVYEGFDD